MWKPALLLVLAPSLVFPATVGLPAYFGTRGLNTCALFAKESAEISSNRLEVGSAGFHIDFLSGRNVPCQLEETENLLSVFEGRDPSAWHSGLPLGRRVRFRSVYPGVDIVYYGDGSKLEYDFELAPGASVSQIRLGFTPNERLSLSANGDLVISTGGRTLLQHEPRVRQGNRSVEAHYMISRNGREVTLSLARYDRALPLTIDPVLSWETATNGNGGGYSEFMATDASGDMWILADIPGKQAPFTNQFGPGGAINQVVVLKVDPSGSQLLYAARIGGSGGDIPSGVAIGADGSAYITGSTSSVDFPVTPNAFQASPVFAIESAFLVKLSPQGNSLMYSTYLSGSVASSGTVIAVDRAGDAFVGGTANPPDFPVTGNAAISQFGVGFSQNAVISETPGFLAKFNSTGTALVYSTLLPERPMGVTVSSGGSAYVLSQVAPGGTSGEFTLAIGNPASGGGSTVRRLTADGSAFDFSVFLSCLSNVDSGGLIALDSMGNIAVAGTSQCSTFPEGTSGAFQPNHATVISSPNDTTGADDGLIVRLAPDGSSVLTATFLGGGDGDEIQAMSIGSDNSVFVAGGTSSGNFPVTSNAFQSYGGGANADSGWRGDGFFAHLSPGLDQLLFSTFLGGAEADTILAMSLDLAGNAYMTGATFSGAALPGAFTFNGSGILWALKVAADSKPLPVISALSPGSLTAGSGDSSVQIQGSGFAQGAEVLVNRTAVTTTFTSSSQVTAVVPAAFLISPATLNVIVLNPASAASNVTILPVSVAVGSNPYPVIAGLAPDSLPSGSAAQNVIVLGQSFVASSVVVVNGSARASSLNGDGSLSVSLTAADFATPGALSFVVTNPSPGGGKSSGYNFQVSAVSASHPPTIASLLPSFAAAGSAATTLTIAASGLSPSAVVRWNGVDHPLSAPILQSNAGAYTFTASASDLAGAGTAEVVVHDYATGLDSNPLPFWIYLQKADGVYVDMGWSPDTTRLYLTDGASIFVLNPATGNIDATVPLSYNAGRIVVSPDGSYLYVAANTGVMRYPLLSSAPWLGAPLNIPTQQPASDFVAMPGHPGTIAIETGSIYPQVTIYDDATARPNMATLPWNEVTGALQFSSDGSILYYALGHVQSLAAMPITSKGVGSPVALGGAGIVGNTVPATVFQGRMYTHSGAVLDTATLAPVGSLPAISMFRPLVTSQSIIMLSSTYSGTCSLQAFDPASFLPQWEEDVSYAQTTCINPYNGIFDLGNAVAFNMFGKVYIVKKPPQYAVHTAAPVSQPITATVELGTAAAIQIPVPVVGDAGFYNLPVTAILVPDQAGELSLAGDYQLQLFANSTGPGTFGIYPAAAAGQYTGKIATMISNTTAPPGVTNYQISVVDPYPLQTSVQSLSFIWPVGSPAPASQTFTLNKQGTPASTSYLGVPYPSWLSYSRDSVYTPATVTIGINTAGLTPGTYTALVEFDDSADSTPVAVPVTLTVIGTPQVSSVQDAESANTQVVPGQWAAIYGSNLAASTRAWNAGDFGSGNALPTTIDGVSVTFGGVPAAVYYVSPGQLNVQVPSGLSGTVPVAVTLYDAPSAQFNATIVPQSPSLFVYRAGGALFPAAIHLDGTLIGDPAVQNGASKVMPGEKIALYVNGLSAAAAGTIISTPIPYSGPLTVTIGNETATVLYAGLVAAGEFQVNIQVPVDLSAGNYSMTIATGGNPSSTAVTLPVQ